jgi:hypothetical protein
MYLSQSEKDCGTSNGITTPLQYVSENEARVCYSQIEARCAEIETPILYSPEVWEPTASPTPGETPEPPSQAPWWWFVADGSGQTPEPFRECIDVPDWHDSGGETYNCAYYEAQYPHLDACAVWGDKYAKLGHTANSACCFCGGSGP